MPNRLTQFVGRLFGRGGETDRSRVPTGPSATPQEPQRTQPSAEPVQEPQAEREGFWQRLNPFGRRERETERARQQVERERAELVGRQRQLEEQTRAIAERERAVREQEARLERERAEREERSRREAERERIEQERMERAAKVAEDLRQAQEADRQRREAERQAREEATRREEERKRATFGKGIPELGIPPITGGKGFTIYGMQTPEEVMQRLGEVAGIEGRRVSIKVHDKNGWHDLYTNKGRQSGRGMTASEMFDRFNQNGVPGQEGLKPVITDDEQPGVSEEDQGDDEEEGDMWGDDGGYDDSYDYVGDSDGGDDEDTEGYDPGSVSGYQVVMY